MWLGVAAALWSVLSACSAALAPAKATRSPIPADARQLVVAMTSRWDSTEAELQRWERAPGGAWRRVGHLQRVWVGATGLGWGRGLHGDGPPAGESGPVKVEGDGRSPAGAFALGDVYGYAAAAPAGARGRYTQVGESWRCVDDPASRRYNQVFDARGVAEDWASAEQMRRADELYEWVVVVEHNPARVPRGGSCIFLHVGRDPTVGCTAFERAEIEALVTWLDPAARPVFVLLPAEPASALAPAWGLPARPRD